MNFNFFPFLLRINTSYIKKTEKYLDEVPELINHFREIIFEFAFTCHTCFKERGKNFVSFLNSCGLILDNVARQMM